MPKTMNKDWGGFLERKKGLHGSNKQKTPLLCDTTNNIGQYQTF
jgi:hypothetical protein